VIFVKISKTFIITLIIAQDLRPGLITVPTYGLKITKEHFANVLRSRGGHRVGAQSGFTIIEVLLAMFILTSSVFVLSQLNMRSLFRVVRDRDEIEKIFLIKKDFNKFIFKLDQKKWPTLAKPQVHKLENPEITISSYVRDIDKKSSLKKFKDQIYIAQSEGTWKSKERDDTVYNAKIVSFVLKPVQEKEKEKK